jgi:hypothetical protein
MPAEAVRTFFIDALKSARALKDLDFKDISSLSEPTTPLRLRSRTGSSHWDDPAA